LLIKQNVAPLAAILQFRYYSLVILKVLIHAAEEGGFWADVPALPGCVSQGETVEEIRSNIREAIEGWLLSGDAEVGRGAADQVIEVAV
jgi:predicted RNase H-like HicB family nuclease